jgi:translation elongation factor EF-1alpha
MGSAGPAQFEIFQVLKIAKRGLVLAGQVRSGAVRAGMQVCLPLNSELTFVATVKSVEFIDHPDGRSDIGLVLEDDDDFSLAGLFDTGEVVLVREAAA